MSPPDICSPARRLLAYVVVAGATLASMTALLVLALPILLQSDG
jgi:hypothetical protein